MYRRLSGCTTLYGSYGRGQGRAGGCRYFSLSESPSLGGMTFSEEQWDAVTAPLDLPVRVVAGPGSGKTRVLAGRIHYILKQFPEDARRIVAVTFTNKASEEMRQRVGVEDVMFGTFHSFCYRQLKMHGAHVMDTVFPGAGDWMVMDQDDCQRLMEKVVKDHDDGSIKSGVLARSLLSKIKRIKNRVGYLDPQTGYESYSGIDENLLFWIKEYEKALRDAGALDFEDLLGVFEHLLKTHDEFSMALRRRFRYVLVDEFQDVNIVQYNIIKHLCGGDDGRHAYVVGDVDQTIFTWRGASGDLMRDTFVQDFPNSVCYSLKDNYRSTKDILGVAQSLISSLDNSDRVGAFRAVREDGHGVPVDVFVFRDPVEEGMGIAEDIRTRLRDGERVAVLLRTHATARFVETALASAQVPYTVVGGVSFWKKSEIRDVMAYLKLSLNTSDIVSFERIINTPKRGIGPSAMKTLNTLAASEGVSVAEYVLGNRDVSSMSKSVRQSLADFRILIESICKRLDDQESLHDVLEYTVESTGYREYIVDKKEEELKKRGRLSNIEQLIDISRDAAKNGNNVWESARSFVDTAALYSEEEGAYGNASVQIMTMHAAKGLEFNRVYIPFATEGLVPLIFQGSSDMDSWEHMDEETRLMFVSITRAKDSLCVSYNRDTRYGRSNTPSRFLSMMFAKECPNIVDFTQN